MTSLQSWVIRNANEMSTYKHLVTFIHDHQTHMFFLVYFFFFLKNYKFLRATRLLGVPESERKYALGYDFPLASCSLLLLSELQWYDGGRRLQRTALCTRCVPHVNYSIHGHVLIVSRAQGFQERFIFSIEGK